MLQLSRDLGLACFSPDYATARRRVLDTCRQLSANVQQGLQQYRHPLTGPDGGELVCDVALLGRSVNPRQLLVLISGTHGVEGFAGSAIQADCLPLLAEVLEQHPSLGVVLVHAFNPWGFAWLRRSDHDGIDLNRNFIDFKKPLPVNEQYEQWHPRLVDPALLRTDDLAGLWQETGIDIFADIVTRGQYRHADGFFFGGNGPSWSRRMLEQVVADAVFASAERIAVIDLHTGLGPYGYGELINDHPPRSAGDAWVGRWYGANARSVHLGESVSTLKEGLLDFFWYRLLGNRGCFVTLEFGTYDMARLLTATLQEQLYQVSATARHEPRDLQNETVQALLDFFYPQEKSWQQQVLFRGRQVVSLACEGLLDV